MRIFALLTDGFGASGGIARYNQDLVTALAQSDRISQVVVLPRFGSSAAATPSNVQLLPPSAGRAAWIGHALNVTARQRFDVIFCGHLNAVPLAAAVARIQKKPLWLQVHGIEAWQPAGPLHRRALAKTALVTSVSRYTRRRLLDWANLPFDQVRVLPNTIAADYTPRAPRDDLIARHNLGGKRVILTVGRLSAGEQYKGHDRVIAALPDVVARVSNAVYVIVGSGEDRPRLEKLAQEAGISDHVMFAGQVSNDELPDYFALAHVFAMPSTGEGFGIVFLEAAASGLAVIGGNRDGSVDALAEGCIGRLIDPASRAEIVEALADALEGRNLADPFEVQRFAFTNFAKHVDLIVRSLAE